MTPYSPFQEEEATLGSRKRERGASILSRRILLPDCTRDVLTYSNQAEEKGTIPTTRTGTQKAGQSLKGKPLYLALFTASGTVEISLYCWTHVSELAPLQSDHHFCPEKEKVASYFLLLTQGLMLLPRMASNFIIIVFQQPSEFWDYRYDSLIPAFLSASTCQFLSIVEHSVSRILLNLCCNASLIQHKMSDIH